MRDSGAGMPTSFSSRMTSASFAFSGSMQLERFLDLVADAENRIQRRARVLKNVADHAAADLLQFTRRHLQSVPAIQQNFPADVIRRRRRHEPRDGKRGDGLAAAAFADEADGFAGTNRQRHAVHGAQGVRAGAEVHFQVFDLEHIHIPSFGGQIPGVTRNSA